MVMNSFLVNSEPRQSGKTLAVAQGVCTVAQEPVMSPEDIFFDEAAPIPQGIYADIERRVDGRGVTVMQTAWGYYNDGWYRAACGLDGWIKVSDLAWDTAEERYTRLLRDRYGKLRKE